MDRKYKSDILQVIHEEAVANFKVKGISEERMRYYDKKCLISEVSAMKSDVFYEEGSTGVIDAGL